MPRQPHGGLAELRLAACLLLAQAALSSGADRGRRADSEIRLLQWNPHWECVAWNQNECGRYAKESVWAELVSHGIDFANIVELGIADGDLPAGWRAIRRKCGVDVIELMYFSHRWQVSDDDSAFASGCMDRNDRPFIVQQFNDVSASGGGRRIIVVAAHYPHSKERGQLRDALASVAEATGVQATILIADTNEDFSVSNDKVMRDINAPGQLRVSTDLHNTCCWNNGVNSFAHGNTYDRIIANFGRMVSTTVLPLPVWGRTGEFHRAVRGVLLDVPDEADRVEVPFRALQRNMTRKAPPRQLLDAVPEARQLALSTQQHKKMNSTLEEAKAAEKQEKEAKAAVEQARLDEEQALAGRKEAERLAEEAAQDNRKAEKLNAAAAEQVVAAESAREKAQKLRQDIKKSTKGNGVVKLLASRVKAEEHSWTTYIGEANKTEGRAIAMKSKAAELSERSDYMMVEAEVRENETKEKMKDAKAQISALKIQSAGARRQVKKDYEKALTEKRRATKDAENATAVMKEAEEMNLKVERGTLNAADIRKKAEQEAQDAKAAMEKNITHDEHKLEVKWKKSEKDMKAARAGNAASNALALKAAKAAEESTALMKQADLEMASANKTFHAVEPQLDEAQKYKYNHLGSGEEATTTTDGGSFANSSERLLIMQRQQELAKAGGSLSLAVATFLLAVPLLACGAAVVGHAVRAPGAAKGSSVRPCDDGDADGTSALLQDDEHEETEQKKRTKSLEIEGGNANAQLEEGSQDQEDPPDKAEAASTSANLLPDQEEAADLVTEAVREKPRGPLLSLSEQARSVTRALTPRTLRALRER